VKVVAINASPKMDKGNTALILDPFLDGMRGAGAEVELFYTKKLDIKPCQGELNCWLRTPGRCFQSDDMETVLSTMRTADVWVLATPLYVWGMSGPLKNLMDRSIPLLQPFFDLSDGHCRHPLRSGTAAAKVVLVSNCGFWELDNFDDLLCQFRDFLGDRFVGALLRPHGPLLKALLEMGAPVHDVVDAAREAGRELVRNGQMSQATLTNISRELMPLEQYAKLVNQNFRKTLDIVEAKAAAN
jgi:multimeric flavodoxin WrbA